MPLEIGVCKPYGSLSELYKSIDGIYPDIYGLYCDLHQRPELAFQEVQTSKTLSERLELLGFQVTRGIGKTGFIARFENGEGKTVGLRTELDAIVEKEDTGVQYASQATAMWNGAMVPVFHGCGHDIHMAMTIGAAELLTTKFKHEWSGSVVVIGQPAEETLRGARAMIEDLQARRQTNLIMADCIIGPHVSMYGEEGALVSYSFFENYGAAVQYFTIKINRMSGHTGLINIVDHRLQLSNILSDVLPKVNKRVQHVRILKIEDQWDYIEAHLSIRCDNKNSAVNLFRTVEKRISSQAKKFGVEALIKVEQGHFVPNVWSREIIEKLDPIFKEVFGHTACYVYDPPAMPLKKDVSAQSSSAPGAAEDMSLFKEMLGIPVAKWSVMANDPRSTKGNRYPFHHKKCFFDPEAGIRNGVASIVMATFALLE